MHVTDDEGELRLGNPGLTGGGREVEIVRSSRREHRTDRGRKSCELRSGGMFAMFFKFKELACLVCLQRNKEDGV